MTLPLLRFVASRDYYTIRIENLEALSVPQIRQLEAFAMQRRSTLDFQTASIRIWKRIDYHHFNKTLEAAGIAADTIESEIVRSPSAAAEAPPERVTAKVGFGKHRGIAYAELPESYLLWLKMNYSGPERHYIDQELAARNL
jgi:hypothetical protein